MESFLNGKTRILRYKSFLCLFQFKTCPFVISDPLNWKKLCAPLNNILSTKWHLVSFTTFLSAIENKMINLATNRLIFNWLSICSFAHETSLTHKLCVLAFTVYVPFIQTLTMISCIMFVFKNIKCNVNQSLYAVMQICAVSCTIFPLIHAYINHRQIEGIFVKLQKIYESMCFRNINE